MDSAPPDVFDRVTFLHSIGGSLEVFRELAELFLGECARRLAAVRDALDHRDSGALEDAAHLIKGSAGYLRAPRAYTAAQTVETLARAHDLTLAHEACAQLEQEVVRLARVLAAQLSQDDTRPHGTTTRVAGA
jgi:HPt (histidine-containing phosphotransfer) domain-containing protein